MNVRTAECLFFRSRGLIRSVPASVRHRTDQTAPDSSEKTRFIPAPTSKYDWIGPPDRLSNLRPIIYHIPENETQLQRKLRHLRQDTEDWNHEFWTRQNITFSKEKEEYIQSQLEEKGLTEKDENGIKQKLSSEEMAAFYKTFLDKNYDKHAAYNKEWYRRNFTITTLMARVTLQNFWRTVTGQARSKGKSTTTS
ncbi:Apoptogenic protein 1, mitochondrial [Bagarius yarrelli]|uniref:Apoptogenic protein 1, mitochondrial n=1 Tax=Bagarius yarrelli TaxID=175774 RepID=A0A556TNB2_BAGYA|nr:Apoptogenic protein 1, mitochondrial [Bagarius yarrelli]